MRELSDFLPHLLVWAPGCPEPTAIYHLREAAIEFCKTMRLWRGDDEFQVTPADCDVVCVPAGAQLIDFEHVTFNGFPLTPKSLAELDRDYPHWETDTQTTNPSYFTQIDIDTIRVVPAATGLLRVRTVLMPAEDGDLVPDWMVEKYARTIAAGALKDILLLPGQPFFNADMAAGFSSRFYGWMDKEGSKSVRGQQRARIRTRARFF